MYGTDDTSIYSSQEIIVHHKSPLLAAFDHIYVINLASRPDRLKEASDELSRVELSFEDPHVTRFDAIRPEDAGEWPSIGARGCYMSHLGILEDASDRSFQRILILEDDFDWSTAFRTNAKCIVDNLCHTEWDFIHGGLDGSGVGVPQMERLLASRGLMQTHFIALSAEAIRRARDYLGIMSERRGGDPRGGPMHVDGAYSWFRKDNTDIAAYVFSPAIGGQRSSRTDIGDLRWYDKAPILANLTGAFRSVLRSSELVRINGVGRSYVPKQVRAVKHAICMFLPGRMGLRNRACFQHLTRTPATGLLEHALAAVEPGDVCIDCGANVGTYTQQFASRGAIVHAFEPDPWTYSQLEVNLRSNEGVTLINAAAGTESGVTSFYRAADFDQSPESRSLASSLVPRPCVEQVAVDVEVIDFPGFLERLACRIRILKMDIEGAEVGILEELLDNEAVLARIDYLFVETHELQYEELLERTMALKARFRSLGNPRLCLDWH